MAKTKSNKSNRGAYASGETYYDDWQVVQRLVMSKLDDLTASQLRMAAAQEAVAERLHSVAERLIKVEERASFRTLIAGALSGFLPAAAVALYFIITKGQ